MCYKQRLTARSASKAVSSDFLPSPSACSFSVYSSDCCFHRLPPKFSIDWNILWPKLKKKQTGSLLRTWEDLAFLCVSCHPLQWFPQISVRLFSTGTFSGLPEVEGQLIQSNVFSGVNELFIGNRSLLLEMLKYQVELLGSWGIPKLFTSLASAVFGSSLLLCLVLGLSTC